VDPAPPASKDQSITEIGANLIDTNLSLFQRYRAMFALRNLNTKESVMVI